MKPGWNSRWVFVVAAAAVVCYQLTIPPVVGLADNGDFVKVIGRFDLYARVYQTYQYSDTTYEFHPERHWVSGYVSSEILLAQAAVWLNSVVGKDGNFDIRCIGAVHAVLFLAALWLFAPLLADARRGLRWAMYGLILFFYCDVKYVSSLNSFYMDEAAYLFLLLTAVSYLRALRWGRIRDAALLLACPLLLVSSKLQHALLGLWIALLFVLAAKALRPIPARVWYAGGGLLTVAAGLMFWKAQPEEYAALSLYNVTFYEILPHSKDVGRTLAELGLDDSYRFCIGKTVYDPGSGMWEPGFRERFTGRYSFGKLAAFYVKHPNVAYRTLRDELTDAAEQHGFGNFDVSAGYGRETESQAFAGWTELRRRVFARGSVFFFTLVALSALLCALLWLERGSLPAGAGPGGLCLIAAAWTEMCLATLCDARDTGRHAMLFLALFDMAALACAYLALRALFAAKAQATLAGESNGPPGGLQGQA